MQQVRDEEVLAGEVIAKASVAQPKKRGLKPGGKHPRVARAFTGIADDDALLTKEEVSVYFGGPARPLDLATIYRGAAQGRYPLPVQIGPNSVRWLLSECREARQTLIEAGPTAGTPPAGTPGPPDAHQRHGRRNRAGRGHAHRLAHDPGGQGLAQPFNPRKHGARIVKSCSVLGCAKPRFARALCRLHYERARRHGDPLGKAQGKARRFFEKVVLKHGADECLSWPFAANNGGVGVMQHGGRQRYVRRMVCEAAHGPAPSPSHDAAQTCGNRRCVAKRHLQWVPLSRPVTAFAKRC